MNAFTRRIIVGGGAALITIGALTGCSPTTEKPAPSSPSSTASSSAATVSPTEKAAGSGNGNSFAPTVKADPGGVCKQVVNGVCQR